MNNNNITHVCILTMHVFRCPEICTTLNFYGPWSDPRSNIVPGIQRHILINSSNPRLGNRSINNQGWNKAVHLSSSCLEFGWASIPCPTNGKAKDQCPKFDDILHKRPESDVLITTLSDLPRSKLVDRRDRTRMPRDRRSSRYSPRTGNNVIPNAIFGWTELD